MKNMEITISNIDDEKYGTVVAVSKRKTQTKEKKRKKNKKQNCLG